MARGEGLVRPEALRRHQVRFEAGGPATFVRRRSRASEEGGEKLVDLECKATNQDGVEVLAGAATAAAA
jgi:hypothetical protein